MCCPIWINNIVNDQIIENKDGLFFVVGPSPFPRDGIKTTSLKRLGVPGRR